MVLYKPESWLYYDFESAVKAKFRMSFQFQEFAPDEFYTECDGGKNYVTVHVYQLLTDCTNYR